MNERQREYFRGKLLAWKDEILKEAKETLVTSRARVRITPISPIAPRPRPIAPSSCALATVSVS